ncbi:monocarboxylate transporter 9 [Gymnogyps californianus]|uniref:monocarboxylate transporter 9 n=1 Tax=Gymnogyps californianus TaxID=33616 RepID=UPI0021C80838|nr:monocarboxylate transporter 9 [Gymnogyps californianus]
MAPCREGGQVLPVHLHSSDKMVFRKPPDGGWGWVVVVVSFFTQFLCYGSPLAVGVLYLEWLDAFGEGKGKTAWVGSLANGIGLLASPVCSICVSSFGARPVAIFSGFMVAGGLMMSSFAPNIYFLYISYGIVVGLGCGLLYTATVTITCHYFDKRRGLALGLISTGSSVGLFIYAALQRELIDLYGLDGCLLIVGALSLNILACGSLMRPLESSDSPPPEKPCVDKVPDQYFVYHEKEKTVEENISILEKGYVDEKCVNNMPDYKQDSILNKNVLSSINVNEKDTYKKKVVEQTNFCKQLAKRKWQRYLNYWEETVVLFKNKVFSALFVAILLFDIGGFPPSLLMEDVARSANINEDDYHMPLISIIGIMTAVGKLTLGILADFKWVNTLYLYVTTLLMTGVALFAIPFAKSYLTLAMLSGILGFLTGNWSIFPYVTTKTVGIEKLTHAYGILMFFAGLGNSLGPPIVGWFYDWTQEYDTAFYFSGFCVLLGGFLLLLAALPCWNACTHQSTKLPPNTYSYKVASSA